MMHFFFTGLLFTMIAGMALAQSASAQSDVPVRKVILFSSGVGYFEHAGAVQGNSQTELRFKTDQINDVLKSLVLQDLNGGQVGTIVYPSQDPISKTLRSFQVDLTGNPTLADLLNQLRGAVVNVTAQGDRFSGTILGLEKRVQAVGGSDGTILESWVLNLISGATIRAVELGRVQNLELQDNELQNEFSQALQALAQARDQDKKPVRIQFQGQGNRQVRVGYVVETPVWKTSYRLILPDNPGDDGYLQGWAIVENQTDNDWADVNLSLVSGRPISFIQDLYQPLYIQRPRVEPEIYANLKPQSYDAGAEPAAPSAMAERRLQSMAPAPMPAEAEEMMIADMDAAFDPTAGVTSVADAEQVGELFQYTVQNVTLPRQRSAMLPIVTDDIEVERVSIYNESVMRRHPLNGAWLKNTSGKHLLQGPITVFDGGGYAGDARINDVPPDQKRLLSFAVDLGVLVDPRPVATGQRVQSGKIVDGVLQISSLQVDAVNYHIENKSDRDKSVIVEHRMHSGAKLIDTPEPVESTDTHYRFRVSTPAGADTTLSVREEAVRHQNITLLSTRLNVLATYQTNGEIPARVREALQEIMTRKQALTRIEQEMRQLDQQRQAITADQERIRENMKTVESGSAYYARLLDKLNDQETEIESILDRIDTLEEQHAQQERELAQYLSNLNVA